MPMLITFRQSKPSRGPACWQGELLLTPRHLSLEPQGDPSSPLCNRAAMRGTEVSAWLSPRLQSRSHHPAHPRGATLHPRRHPGGWGCPSRACWGDAQPLLGPSRDWGPYRVSPAREAGDAAALHGRG